MKQIDRSESGAAPRRKFDEVYKRHAVELTLHGDRTVKTVAKELGLPSWQLYEWRKIYAPRPGDGGPPPQTRAGWHRMAKAGLGHLPLSDTGPRFRKSPRRTEVSGNAFRRSP